MALEVEAIQHSRWIYRRLTKRYFRVLTPKFGKEKLKDWWKCTHHSHAWLIIIFGQVWWIARATSMEKQASDTLERLFQYPTRLTSWPEYFIIHTQSNQDHPDSIYITLPAFGWWCTYKKPSRWTGLLLTWKYWRAITCMHTILKRQVYVLVDRIHMHKNKREGATKGILHAQDRERLWH